VSPDDLLAAFPTLRERSVADVEAYCDQVARMRDAAQRVQAEGLIVSDEKGRPVPHPALIVERLAGAEVRAWSQRLGLGDVVADDHDGDDLADFLSIVSGGFDDVSAEVRDGEEPGA